MKDFNSYIKDGNKGKKNDNNFNNDAMSMLQYFANKYEGASQDELIAAILEEAERGRKNGTLSNKDIDNFANLIIPMLNPSQQNTLKKVLDKIKKKN